jgi:hypothetical protein
MQPKYLDKDAFGALNSDSARLTGFSSNWSNSFGHFGRLVHGSHGETPKNKQYT